MENENIESVKDLTIHLIKQNKGVVIAAILFGVFFILFVPPLGIFLIIFPFLYYSWEAHEQFMRHFAEINGMIYTDTGTVKDFNGRLFEIGSGQRVSNIVSGIWNNFPIKIFNFSYTVNHGKHSSTHSFTVMEITFEKIEFPFILLKSKTMWEHNFSLSDDTNISINNDCFDLSVIKGYEVETLQIFSEKLLEYLTKNAENFSIEFSKNKINIYFNDIIGDKKNLTLLLEIGKHIIDSSGAFISRLNDDFAALHPYYLNKTT